MSQIRPIPQENSLVVIPQPRPELPGFPIQRPDGWPAVMAWPPKRLHDAARRGQLNEDNIPKFEAYYKRFAELSQRQAERFSKYVDEHRVKDEDAYKVGWFRMKKNLGYDNTRNHNHVAWAFMLDPNGDFRGSYDQMVTGIGRTSLTTADGGRIHASENAIDVRVSTEMAAKVLVEEALARGWDRIEVRGHKKFVQMVMKEAKMRNLEVEARVPMFGRFGPAITSTKFNFETLGIDQDIYAGMEETSRELSDSLKDPRKKPKKGDSEPVMDSGNGPAMV